MLRSVRSSWACAEASWARIDAWSARCRQPRFELARIQLDQQIPRLHDLVVAHQDPRDLAGDSRSHADHAAFDLRVIGGLFAQARSIHRRCPGARDDQQAAGRTAGATSARRRCSAAESKRPRWQRWPAARGGVGAAGWAGSRCKNGSWTIAARNFFGVHTQSPQSRRAIGGVAGQPAAELPLSGRQGRCLRVTQGGSPGATLFSRCTRLCSSLADSLAIIAVMRRK